jgi:hypothetical protein
MANEYATLPEDSPPPRTSLPQRMRVLPTGSKIVCAAGFLLFVSLFLTWQNREVTYGQAGTNTEMLDGWDAWGVFVGFATVGVVTLVLLLNAWDVDLSPEIRWDLVVFSGCVAILAVLLVKTLRDADSAWASYVGLALASAMVVGAYLDWADERPRRSLRRPRRRRFSGAA